MNCKHLFDALKTRELLCYLHFYCFYILWLQPYGKLCGLHPVLSLCFQNGCQATKVIQRTTGGHACYNTTHVHNSTFQYPYKLTLMLSACLIFIEFGVLKVEIFITYLIIQFLRCCADPDPYTF